MNALVKRIGLLESQVSVNVGQTTTAVGLVCPKEGLVRTIVRSGVEWETTLLEPDVYIPLKMEAVLKSTKRFIIVIGGRGSGKSVGVTDVCLIDAKDTGSKTYCLREYQSSIKNSVHSLLKEEKSRLEFEGFDVKETSIKYNGKDSFEFAGLARNVDSIKSAHGFKRFWIEEAQFISEDSLTALTPTARKKPKKGAPTELEEVMDGDTNVSMVFVANPGSSEDPFSQRFIVPFQEQLDRDGFYEDDLHLIVVMNYDDNPWYHQSGLEEERLWDLEHRSRALYDHIWKGAYNDSVENALILAEWFDACIDAHIKKGFKAVGARMASHDPSDTGGDTKGYAMRHGSVVLAVEEKLDGNVNEGGHWAAGLAIQHNVDSFTWDCDGMGIGLGEQMAKDLGGKKMGLINFKGSESPDFPDTIYKPAINSNAQDQRTVKDSVKNKRAQYYLELRERVYRTYRAVVHDEYCDPEKMISFSSEIKLLPKLRSEVCRMPVKDTNRNGLFELYTKPEMKAKFKLVSPNLGDSLMMLMRAPIAVQQAVRMPQPLPPMGR